MNLKLKSPPSREPVSLELLKTHLRLSFDHEDLYLEHLVKTARAQIELATNRCLITQIWEVSFFEPSIKIRLPLAPVKKIKSIQVATAKGDKVSLGVVKTILDNKENGPILTLPHMLFGQVKIQFECGYGEETFFVPEPLKHGILLLAAHYYEERGDQSQKLPESIQALVQPYIYNRLSF